MQYSNVTKSFVRVRYNYFMSSIEKANLLNEFFVSCFNTSIPPLDADNSFLSPVCPDLFPDDLLCTEDVFDLLVSLNVTKSSHRT